MTNPTEALAALVRDFLDPDPCRLDHHGYCQAHSWLCEGRCPHARAREVLAAYDAAPAVVSAAAPSTNQTAEAAPADRAAVLREVASQLEAAAERQDRLSSSDYDQESYAAFQLRDQATALRRLADEAQQQETPSMRLARASVEAMAATLQRPATEPPVHGESVAALAGYGPDGRDQWEHDQQDDEAGAAAQADEVATPFVDVLASGPTTLRARVLREIIGRITGTTPGDSATERVGAAQVLAVLREILAETEPAVVEPAEAADTETPPTVAYSGKGRTFCVRCPRPDGEDVPLTVNDVDPWDLCPSCGRHVVDVARAQQDGAAS